MDGWGRVVVAVVDRRAELGLTQRELAAAAGVSERTIQSLEAGSRPQARNRHKIERALGWRNGEMRRIEEDVGTAQPRVPPELAGHRELVDEIRRTLPDPEVQARVMAEIAATMRGDPPPREPGAGAGGRSSERRAG